MSLNLYAVYLGAQNENDELLEDHRLVFVVAEDKDTAKKKAVQKWNAKGVHVDNVKVLDEVDGFNVIVKKYNSSL